MKHSNIDKKSENFENESNVGKVTKEVKASCIKCDDIKDLGLHYWLIVFIALAELGAMDPFRNVANDFISQRFGFNNKTAGKLLLILYL